MRRVHHDIVNSSETGIFCPDKWGMDNQASVLSRLKSSFYFYGTLLYVLGSDIYVTRAVLWARKLGDQRGSDANKHGARSLWTPALDAVY
jgi:hypothetical protein